MHGRLKVKTSAEQQLEKDRERAKKLQQYNAGWQLASSKRRNGEHDSEALEVTGHLLLANPDLYSMWNFRKEILQTLKLGKETADFQELMNTELSFTELCLRANPKSYGSWQQRVWTLENMPEPNWSRELQLCNKYLELDERNFHVWDYRRYVVSRSDVAPKAELEFSDSKISANFSNYSSWHYRSKLLPKIFPDSSGARAIAEEKLLEELELVQNAAFTDPNDQSAWFYHRWLLGRGKRQIQPIFLYAALDDNILLVAFNRALSKKEVDEHTTMSFGSKLIDINWRYPYDGAKLHSHVWIGWWQCNVRDFKDADPCFLSVGYFESIPSIMSKLDCGFKDGESENWVSSADRWMNFSMELSSATSAVLTAELQSCVELQDLEPDSKWPLLTAILLMKSLDYRKYESVILDNFNKLLEVDPDRANYYCDLRSKFCLENMEGKLGPRDTVLNLSGHQLTTFYHKEYFLQVKVLDLSDNCLTSLRDFSVLHFLESLIVDRNTLTNLDGLQGLTKLTSVSAQSNSISDFGGLQCLTTLSTLCILNLTGNSVCLEKDYNQRIKELVPTLKTLDD